MNAIEIQGLTKRYGPITAVDGLDLTVRQGELFALLGVNGAGKTTTIKMLSCLTRPDGGDARLLGRSVVTDTAAVKNCIGVSPQETAVAPNLTARENLLLMCGVHGLHRQESLARVEELARTLGLEPVLARRAGKLSGGWQRRLSIAMALVARPEILFLDEPTNHLDIAAREWVEEAVEAFDGTLLFVSHDRYFINRFATRIWELADGTITDYPMGFTQYQAVKAQEKQERTPAPVREKRGDTRPAKGNRSQQAARRQLTICENTISKLETEIADLDGQMQQVGRDPDKLAEVYAKKMETENSLQEQMARWEELSLQLEE